MRKLVRVACAMVAALIAASALPAVAQEILLKVHHFQPPIATSHAQFMVPWCDKIAKESSNRLKCQIYPAMSLGGTPAQLYDQAKDGVADIVWTLPGYTAGRFPLSEVFELPFMMTDTQAGSRALWDYVQLHAKEEFRDVRLLSLHVHGPGVIHARDRQVKALDDLKGMKIRAPTRLTNRLLAALGATPVGMPVPAVPEALSKGVIDGAVIPWEVVPSIKVQELTRFHTETDRNFPALYAATFVFAMNPAKYNSLPADLKKIIDANSGAQLSSQAGALFAAADAPARKLAEARKNQFYTLPAAELAKWRKAAEPIQEDWIRERNRDGQPGLKLVESARALIAKYSK